MKRIRQSSLSYREGNSDKVYEAELIELGPDRYLVGFRYGKRGATLREGSKTQDPVPFEAAAKLYKSLVVEKLNKGYKLEAGFDPRAGELKAPAGPEAAAATMAVDRAAAQAAHVIACLQAYAEGREPQAPSWSRQGGRQSQQPAPAKGPGSRRRLGGKLADLFTLGRRQADPDPGPEKTAPVPREASLGRCIQRAGELGLSEAAALLPQFLAQGGNRSQRVLNYAVAWNLARLVRPEGLGTRLDSAARLSPERQAARIAAQEALPRLRQVLSKSQFYLFTELELLLSTPAEAAALIESRRRRELESAEAFAALGVELAAGVRAELLSCSLLSPEALATQRQMLALRGLEQGVDAALAGIDLDMDAEAFWNGLPEPLRAALRRHESHYQDLIQAVAKLLGHRRHELKEALMASEAEDQRRYRRAIGQVDLRRIISQAHTRNYAGQGKLSWIWAEDKEALILALSRTELGDEARALYERIESRDACRFIQGKYLVPAELEWTRRIVAGAGELEALDQKLASLPLRELDYAHFVRQHLSPGLAARIAADPEGAARALFSHRQAELRASLQARRSEAQDHFSAGLLALYRQALIDAEARALLLKLAAELPFDRSAFRLLRKLYKLAELRRDHELLALLYHRIETTPALATPSEGGAAKTELRTYARPTRNYLRRRMPRLLASLARREPEQFLALACEILLRLRDGEPAFAPRRVSRGRWYRDARNHYQRRTTATRHPDYADHLALNYLLRSNSLHYRRLKSGLSWVELDTKLPESSRPEALPALWDSAPHVALRLLLGAQASIVNDFALGLLRRQPDFCAGLGLADWLTLAARPYENTAAFAFEALKPRLHEPAVLAGLLLSPLAGIRARALQALAGRPLAQVPELAARLLISPYADLREALRRRLPELTGQEASLCRLAIEKLIANVAADPDSELLAASLAGARELLCGPLRGQTSRELIEALLRQADARLQRLGAGLLSDSDFAYAELEHLLPLLEASPDPELQAAALRQLAKLPPDQYAEQTELLLATLLAGEDALRSAARELLLGLHEPETQRRAFNSLLPWLFRSQAEGPGEDLLALVASWSGLYRDLDADLLWRLLTARSKLAQQAGSLIVTARAPAEFSLRQLVRLSKHASLGVRDWALAALKQDPRGAADFALLLESLDNPWAETRAALIAWLRSLPPETWNPERTLAVCDQVNEDVQAFGRELVTHHFEAGRGAFYLQRLSQHPSRQLQLFVSGFLAEYADAELLLQLRPYFETVLSQVNRGRLLKHRALALLRRFGQDSPAVARMLAEILGEHSLTAVVADKARYIETLYDLQRQDSALAGPLKLIAPRTHTPRRAASSSREA